MLPLMLSIVMAQMPKQAPFIAKPIVSIIAWQTMNVYVRPKLRENFDFVEAQLAGKAYFVGDTLTGADGALFPRFPLSLSLQSMLIL